MVRVCAGGQEASTERVEALLKLLGTAVGDWDDKNPDDLDLLDHEATSELQEKGALRE